MRRLGVWIDQERAVIVEFTAGGPPHTVEMESHAPGRVRIRGGMHGSSGGVDAASHKKTEEKRLARLDRFYEEVAKALEGADRIAVIGPGQAKRHLAKKVDEQHDPGEVIATLPADKMTDRQIVARLREILRLV